LYLIVCIAINYRGIKTGWMMRTYYGHTGNVEFDGQFVTIVRRSILSRLTVGKGEKRVPIVSIAAVQWKPAGLLTNGYIEFSIAGGNESRSRFGHATRDAVRNENAVVFTRGQQASFETLRKEVDMAIAQRHSAPTGQSNSQQSVAELIHELANLRKKGIVTPAEYEKKKADLLRRM
jgi:hypothetical protein